MRLRNDIPVLQEPNGGSRISSEGNRQRDLVGYVKKPSTPQLPVPVSVRGGNGGSAAKINMTIVVREGRRPEVTTRVIRVDDSAD